ncbi:hypothetical protein CF326_g7701, partial [Tilletia indica]
MSSMPSSSTAAHPRQMSDADFLDAAFLMRRFVVSVDQVGGTDMWTEILASLPLETQYAVVSAATVAARRRQDPEDAVTGLQVVEGKLESLMNGGSGGGAAFAADGGGEEDGFEVVKTLRGGEPVQGAGGRQGAGQTLMTHPPQQTSAEGRALAGDDHVRSGDGEAGT